MRRTITPEEHTVLTAAVRWWLDGDAPEGASEETREEWQCLADLTRLMDDLGWGEDEGLSLTMPDADLERVLRALEAKVRDDLALEDPGPPMPTVVVLHLDDQSEAVRLEPEGCHAVRFDGLKVAVHRDAVAEAALQDAMRGSEAALRVCLRGWAAVCDRLLHSDDREGAVS